MQPTKCIMKYHSPTPSLQKPNGQWAKSDGEKADSFADYLQDIFTLHDDIEDPNNIITVQPRLLCPSQISLPPKTSASAEVKNQIALLPRNKSPGYDIITAQVLC